MLQRGVYETLITDLLSELLTDESAGMSSTHPLRNAEAADRLAYHLGTVVERSISSFPEKDRANEGAQLVRRLVELIAAAPGRESLRLETPKHPPKILRAINNALPDGTAEAIDGPLIPLLDTALLTNAPGEPRVGHQIQAEIQSADRIDVVMAFIRRSGIAPLRESLRKHVQAGRALRVLTTTYTGSTEAEALEWLVALGADVRISYDIASTRLHAKSWLFHRNSGFSTAYVGSSNLTHSAQVSGLEWNVRVSGARNRPVIEKISAVFDSYWEQPDFERYDAKRFKEATKINRPNDAVLTLAPIEIRLEPFQERLLEEIEISRQQGHHRNLLVSATGTGKTVMAAVDYARLRTTLPRARLLFVAHREELLTQSRATFAHALRDGSFGELWVGGHRPTEFEHVFASIQSLSANSLNQLEPEYFDVVIVDEFHHAAAATYTRLLDKLKPTELLALTATPERSDGLSLLHWFDGKIAAELRLWDAIDQHRLTPFAYYGIADDLDLRDVPWTRSTGYEVEGLTNLITGTDVWARKVLSEFADRVGRLSSVRALGFCVSVNHARYMARVFAEHGVAAVAIWAATPDAERKKALSDLAAGRVNVVFSVDLFNEGIDVPSVDTLLMLRPTESPLLFLQQLGRGLRKYRDKSICTVLDFVGQHRREFRYDPRFRALLGGSRAAVTKQIEAGFPFLPAGCHMELDQVASERVLRSIRDAIPSNWPQKVAELQSLLVEQPTINLAGYLESSGLDLEDVYAGNHSWSELRQAAGMANEQDGPHERILRRATARLLHVDDVSRLDAWKNWLESDTPPAIKHLSVVEQRLLRMLLSQLLDQVPEPSMSIAKGARLLWEHPQVRLELLDLIAVLSQRVSHVTSILSAPSEVPLRIHAQYTRLEILSACGIGNDATAMTWQTGVLYAEELHTDLLAFTLDKTSGQFSPTTRYRDYAISRELVHWESQSVTWEDSKTGVRYQNHAALGNHILLFARLSASDRAFFFLGPATYMTHIGEQPMAVTWRLHVPLPGDLFQAFAAAVA